MGADPLDEPFLAMALAAFATEARAVKGWPDSERVRQRAYREYEVELRRMGEAAADIARQPTLADPDSSR